MELYATEHSPWAQEAMNKSPAKHIGHYSTNGKSYQIRYIDLSSVARQSREQNDQLLSALTVARGLIKTPDVGHQDARSARIESELVQRTPGQRKEKSQIKTPVVKNRENLNHADDVPNYLATKINVLPKAHQHLAKNILKNLKQLEKNKKINGMKFLKALKALDSILEQSTQLREIHLKALNKKCEGGLG